MSDQQQPDEAEVQQQRRDARTQLQTFGDVLLAQGFTRAAVIMALGDVVSELVGHGYGPDQGDLMDAALTQFSDVVRGQAHWHRRRECEVAEPAIDLNAMPTAGRPH